MRLSVAVLAAVLAVSSCSKKGGKNPQLQDSKVDLPQTDLKLKKDTKTTIQPLVHTKPSSSQQKPSTIADQKNPLKNTVKSKPSNKSESGGSAVDSDFEQQNTIKAQTVNKPKQMMKEKAAEKIETGSLLKSSNTMQYPPSTFSNEQQMSSLYNQQRPPFQSEVQISLEWDVKRLVEKLSSFDENLDYIENDVKRTMTDLIKHRSEYEAHVRRTKQEMPKGSKKEQAPPQVYYQIEALEQKLATLQEEAGRLRKIREDCANELSFVRLRQQEELIKVERERAREDVFRENRGQIPDFESREKFDMMQQNFSEVPFTVSSHTYGNVKKQTEFMDIKKVISSKQSSVVSFQATVESAGEMGDMVSGGMLGKKPLELFLRNTTPICKIPIEYKVENCNFVEIEILDYKQLFYISGYIQPKSSPAKQQPASDKVVLSMDAINEISSKRGIQRPLTKSDVVKATLVRDRRDMFSVDVCKFGVPSEKAESCPFYAMLPSSMGIPDQSVVTLEFAVRQVQKTLPLVVLGSHNEGNSKILIGEEAAVAFDLLSGEFAVLGLYSKDSQRCDLSEVRTIEVLHGTTVKFEFDNEEEEVEKVEEEEGHFRLTRESEMMHSNYPERSLTQNRKGFLEGDVQQLLRTVESQQPSKYPRGNNRQYYE